jgi:hypothetical protein
MTHLFYVEIFRQGKVNQEAIARQFLPIAVIYAVSLVLSNKAYIYLAVSYIQVRPYNNCFACTHDTCCGSAHRC